MADVLPLEYKPIFLHPDSACNRIRNFEITRSNSFNFLFLEAFFKIHVLPIGEVVVISVIMVVVVGMVDVDFDVDS